jgi:hypothetical protein
MKTYGGLDAEIHVCFSTQLQDPAAALLPVKYLTEQVQELV